MSNNVYVGEGLLTRFEEKTTPRGNRVCTFSILLPERPPAEGQPPKPGTFIPVESWDITPQLAGLLSKNVKNCRVFVKGRLKLDRWTDKTSGKERTNLKVIADRVAYVPIERKQQPAPQQPRPTQPTQQAYDENGNPIPF